MSTLTDLFHVRLIALAGNQSILASLGLSGGSLERLHPSITLGDTGSLECVFLAVELEGKVEGAILDDVGSLSLKNRLAL
jgi:hypothetical protein